MAAADRLLARTGEVSELSLRAVAREVGVAATSLYLHFHSLDELMLAVRLRYLDEFGQALAAAADAAGTAPLDRVRARAHEYVRYGLAHEGRYRATLSSEGLPTHLVPSVVATGLQVFEAFRDELVHAAEAEVDASMLAVHVWTALHGIVMLRMVRYAFPWPGLTDEIDDLIDRLVSVRPGPRPINARK